MFLFPFFSPFSHLCLFFLFRFVSFTHAHFLEQGAVVCWNLSPCDRKAAFETTPIGESYEGGDKRVIGIALERAVPGSYFWILLVQKPQ